MNILGKKSWAYVKSNKDFIFIETYSGYRNCLPDSEGKQFILMHSISDYDLGIAISEALAVSRQIDPKESPGFFDFMGRVIPLYESWVAQMIVDFGYKTRRAMFKDMKSCSVESLNGFVSLQPSYHEKLEAWSGKGITEGDYVVVSENSSFAEIGAALRLALSRCK